MKKGKTVQFAYEFIKQKIDSGTWDNGVKIIEQDISNELAISRTPIREAIKWLMEENYLSKELNRGVVVSKRVISTEEFIERTQLLELLLSNYIFQLQTKHLNVDWDETKLRVEELSKEVDFDNKQECTANLLTNFLVSLNNGVMTQIILKNARQLHYVVFPHTETSFLYVEVVSLFNKMLKHLSFKDYDLARKDIRVFFNRLNLELIDDQF